MAVLHQLSQEAEAVSFPQIIEKLGQGYSARSARRWLGEIIEEGLVEKSGNKKGTRHRVLQRGHRPGITGNRCFINPRGQKVTTVKAMGLDAIRVRYRHERRSIIHDIILNDLHGNTMETFILNQTAKLIKKEDQLSFIEDVHEDLREINGARIVGLGITHDQLNHWLRVCP